MWNVALSARIALDLAGAGVKIERIFHSGSYTVDSPRSGAYQVEKRELERSVSKGVFLGRVLRLPIVLLADALQREILSSLYGEMQAGSVEGALRLAVIQPLRLREIIDEIPSESQSVIIVGGELKSIAALAAEWHLEPHVRRNANEFIETFRGYTSRFRNGESFENHYESQTAKAMVR